MKIIDGHLREGEKEREWEVTFYKFLPLINCEKKFGIDIAMVQNATSAS